MFAAAAIVLLGPAVALFAVKHPGEVGQREDGDAQSPVEGAAAATSAAAPEPLSAVLRDRNFWLLGASLALATGASLGGVHLVHHLQNVGVSATQAGVVAATMSAGALLGRVCTGWLHDRFHKPLVAAVVFVLAGVGWIGIAYAQNLGQFLALAVPVGFAAGGFGVSGAVLQAACFGPHVLGRVMGLRGVLGLPALLAVPVLVGRSGDAQGGFALAFGALGAVMCVAAAAMLLVRTTRATGTSPATTA